MEATTLLATKLYIPRLREGYVARPRLLERLDAGMQTHLTLLSAAAGFGKSTLLSEWSHVTGTPTAWLVLDAEDNETTRFLTYLIGALQTLYPEVGTTLLTALQTLQPPPMEQVVATLVNELVAIEQDFALIIDDYHLIDAAPIHSLLTYLLDHLPPSMHLYIASRTDPPLPLSRLRVRRQLIELRAADLRFRMDETTKFLDHEIEQALKPEAIATLQQRTEGWIAGLQLAAISLQGQGDPAHFIADFAGSHHYVVDFLAEEIFNQQTSEVQDFLLATSILDRFTAPLCDVVIGAQNSDRLLAQLEQMNLLLIPLDEARQWYRYHQLFASFLRSRLAKIHSMDVAQLHTRAANWFEEAGNVTAAIEHLLAARQWAEAAHLIEANAEPIVLRGGTNIVLRWLDTMPAAFLQTQMALRVLQIGLAILQGQVENAEAQLQAVEDALQAANASATLSPSSLTPAAIQALQGEISALRAHLALLRGELPLSIELSQQALDDLPEEKVLLRGMVALSLANMQRARGDVAAANIALAAATSISEADSGLYALLIRMQLKMLLGKLRDAAQIARRILHLAQANDTSTLGGADQVDSTLNSANTTLGELLYEWNELEEAGNFLHAAVAQSQRSGAIGPQLSALIHLTRVVQAQHDQPAVAQLVQQVQELSQQLNLPRLDTQLKAWEARLALLQGNLESAERWARQIDLEPTAALNLAREQEYLLLARVWLQQGNVSTAATLLLRLWETFAQSEWNRSKIEILKLLALTMHAKGSVSSAIAHLVDALELAQPEDYIRAFIDEGAPMQQLLQILQKEQLQGHYAQIEPDYVEELLAAFVGVPEAVATRPTQQGNQTLVEPLTERELDVLQCMANGLSNAEIAEELVVAVSTVRTHIKNVYGKLAVRNRVEAVTRGQELQLVRAA